MVHIEPQTARAMQDTIRQRTPRGDGPRGVWARLVDALLALTGGHAQLVRHSERPWASATFSGSRHMLNLAFEGAEAVVAAEQFIADLPDHEFSIAGQLVADAMVIEAEQTMLPEPRFLLEVEVLLLEDR